MPCSSASYFAVPDTVVESIITTSSVSVIEPLDEILDPPALPLDTIHDRRRADWTTVGKRRRPRQRPPSGRLGAVRGRGRPILLMEAMRRLGAELTLPDSFGPVTLQHHLANVVHALERLNIRLTCSRKPYGEHLDLAELYERIYRRIVIDRLPAPSTGTSLVIDLTD